MSDINNIIDKDISSYNEIELIIKDMNNEYDKVVSDNNKLNLEYEELSKQNNSLKTAYNKILEEENKKKTFMIKNVPVINQYALGYPTGCESAALTNLLNYYGVSVSIKDVVKVLPKGDLPYYENGVMYGGNPYLEFIGHPTSLSSYGVYEKPILDVANKFKSGAINGTGMSLNQVLNIVKENRPVIVWVSMDMRIPYISKSWIYKKTGETIKWMAEEHALVVIGYNQNQVIVSDSLGGRVRYYDKSVFENRYNAFGKRAIYY